MSARGGAVEGAEVEAGPKRQSQRDTETKTHRDNESRRLWRDFFGSRFAAIAEALFIYVFFALFCIFCFWFFCLQIFYFFFLFCFFFFLVKRARVRWPLPVDRFVLSQSADVSPQQSKARSSFRAKYVFTLRVFGPSWATGHLSTPTAAEYLLDLSISMRIIAQNHVEPADWRGNRSTARLFKCFGSGSGSDSDSGAASQGCQFLDSSQASFHIVPDWAEKY